jgi:hypothetical protein
VDSAGVQAVNGLAGLEIPFDFDYKFSATFHQNRVRVAKVLEDVAAQSVRHRLGIPHRTSQQMLRPVRAGIPGMLGDRPAVRPRKTSQQSRQERPRPRPLSGSIVLGR